MEKNLTEKSAAELLGVSAKTMQAWRWLDRGPRYIKFSNRAIRYRESDLQDFIKTNIVGTAEHAA